MNTKVAPEVLREIALEIKSRETRQYQRTLIQYYLPQYDPASRKEMWARSDFDPTLKVEILGLSIETERKAREIPIVQKGALLGPWFIDDQLGCRKVLIYEDVGKIKLGEFSDKWGRSDLELTEVPVTVGRRFKLTDGNDQFEVAQYGVLPVYGYENRLLSATPPDSKKPD